jgi:peptidoglycan hydrolase CwlO-like protein
MFVEQTIELKSAEAREKAAIKIRDRDKAFVDLFIQWKNLSGEVNNLKANLKSAEKQVKELEERLINPEPYMLPPELYQNKVTIYPVLPE